MAVGANEFLAMMIAKLPRTSQFRNELSINPNEFILYNQRAFFLSSVSTTITISLIYDAESNK